MNILIIGDDGPASAGQVLLYDAAKMVYPEANIVSMYTKRPMSGQGTAVTTSRSLDELLSTLQFVEGGDKPNKKKIMFNARPMDLLYMAMIHPGNWITKGTWDLCLTGVNYGHNVGMDVYHSGTVGPAMMAALQFACPSVAVSQEMDTLIPSGDIAKDTAFFRNVVPVMRQFLESTVISPGSCFNVNLPKGDPSGWSENVPVAHYSRWHRPPVTVVPRARDEKTDHTELAKGLVTVSPLSLQVNQSLRY